MSDGTATLRFAEHLAAIRAETLEEGVLDRLRQHLFDIGGAAVAGYDESGAGLKVALGAGPLEDIIELCAAVRCSEIDDIHTGCCITAGAVALPVALVLARTLGCSDRDVAAAAIAGYEAMIAIGMAIDGAHAVYRGIWPSFFAAPIGGAVTAAHLLGLDAEGMRQAIVIAAARISGAVWVTPHPSARWLAFASSVAEGVRAAYMARAGLTGNVAFLEVGLPRTIRVEVSTERLLDRLGRGSALLGAEMKPFFTGRQSLSAVEAARMAGERFGDGPIDAIRVRVPEPYRAMIDRPDASGASALGSVQLQMAIALRRPDALYTLSREQVLADPAVRELMKKVTVAADPELTALYPGKWPAIVEIEGPGGKTDCRVDDPSGSAARPLGWDGVAAKHAAIGCLGDRLDPLRELCADFAAEEGSKLAVAYLTVLSGALAPAHRQLEKEAS